MAIVSNYEVESRLGRISGALKMSMKRNLMPNEIHSDKREQNG